MITQIWDTVLGANTLTSYADAAALMKQQGIYPIVGWEAPENMLEQWIAVVTVLLSLQEHHQAVFDLTALLKATEEVKYCLRAQAAVQQDMPAALVQFFQTEFNESFRQVFTNHLQVLWPHFTPLILTLTTCHFHPGTVTILGGFRSSTPASLTQQWTAALPLKTSESAQQVGDASTCTTHVAVQNTTPLPHLQVGPGFRLRH